MDQNLTKIAEKTLNILKKRSWSSLNINDVCRSSKLNTKKFNNKIKKKSDLIINIIKYFDEKLIKSATVLDKSNRKDMIFELMMLRFDILQIHRNQIIQIYNSIKKRPQEIIKTLPAFIDSMIMMAKISNISTHGIKGNLKIKGLLVIYFSSFLVWTKDNTNSLEKTMTALDKNLNQAEKIINLVKK